MKRLAILIVMDVVLAALPAAALTVSLAPVADTGTAIPAGCDSSSPPFFLHLRSSPLTPVPTKATSPSSERATPLPTPNQGCPSPPAPLLSYNSLKSIAPNLGFSPARYRKFVG
jgi:hypothetical protein